ncbi:MAG: hypothetical protein GY861_11925 [bacterium]|nr:hypothetical protein [bacterium]
MSEYLASEQKQPTDAEAIMKATTDLPGFGPVVADFVNAVLIRQRKGMVIDVREELAAEYVLDNFQNLIKESVPIVREYDAIARLIDNLKIKYMGKLKDCSYNTVSRDRSHTEANRHVKEDKDNIHRIECQV